MNIHITTQYDEHVLYDIETLYENAFPSSEKKPFDLLVRQHASHHSTIYAIFADDTWIGLLITLNGHDATLIDYFAIEPQYRNQGLGQQALQQFCQTYQEQCLCLEAESATGKLPSSIESRRIAFYERCGFSKTNYEVDLFGVQMNILWIHHPVSFPQYSKIISDVFGGRILFHVQRIEA
jgi:ribosomal protein S18 acetylase RimI-like enzyme